MTDVYLEWGCDLSSSPTGDIMLAAGTDAITQRICRRLLTNTGDYIWQLDYGASLGMFVGSPANPGSIEAVIRSQLALETGVPTDPVPTVSVAVADPANGIVSSTITYAAPASRAPVVISLITPVA